MKGISRRAFLKAMGSTASLAAMGALMPRFLYAQTIARSAGNGKNIIMINLNGGFDGLGVFPIYNGVEAEYINNVLRPTIHLDPSEILNPVFGNAKKRGLHPEFGTLATEVANQFAMIQQIGIPVYPGGSHSQCQKIYSLGSQEGLKSGWIGRMMDIQNLDSFQVYGLGVGRKLDFVTQKEPALILSSLSRFNYQNRNFGSTYNFIDDDNDNRSTNASRDSVLSREMQRRFEDLEDIDTDAKKLLKSGHQTIERSIAYVREIASQPTVGNYNLTGSSTISSFGRRCQDSARLLTFLGSDPEFQSKSKLIYLERGGWDTHSNQESSLNNNIRDIASSLRGIVQDLKAAGLWNDTVIYVSSEFGRTSRENGGQGTDHAYANTHLALGGSVQQNLFGEFPLLSELENRNRLSVDIDFRRPLAEIMNWAGFSGSQIFSEDYDSRPLGLFT